MQRRQGERRRLWDRRSPVDRRARVDRRQAERRRSPGLFAQERRTGLERRRGERRCLADRRCLALRRHGRRRRETPTPFTAEQVTDLRVRFAAPGVVTCPACGSRFSLGPARRRGEESARRVVCLGCGRAAVVPNTRAARVLIVNGHDGLRETLQQMLSAAGHEVVETADAGVGLVAYRTVPADVILVNTQATGRMTTYDFLRQLRREFPDARVVAISLRHSLTGADPLALSLGLGAIRTLRMPMSREDLLRAVDEARR